LHNVIAMMSVLIVSCRILSGFVG